MPSRLLEIILTISSACTSIADDISWIERLREDDELKQKHLAHEAYKTLNGRDARLVTHE